MSDESGKEDLNTKKLRDAILGDDPYGGGLAPGTSVDELLVAARRDALTGLSNREALKVFLANERIGFGDKPAAVMLVDIDHFKNINDTYGHQAGDGVLQIAAQRIRAKFPLTDLICRLGGDEFLVISFGLKELDSLKKRAEELRRLFEKNPVDLGGKRIPTTISVGIGKIGVGESFEEWFERVDQAMYEAKKSGRNRIEVAK